SPLLVPGVNLCVGADVDAGFGLRLAQRFALERQADGVVDEAVEDGVGVGGIANGGVPAVHRKLAGQNDGTAVVAVVDDLHEVSALGRGQVDHRPIVQNQDADSGHLAHQPAHAI